MVLLQESCVKYLKQNHNRHAGVKIIKSDIFCLEAFIGCACDKLDTYLNDKFDPQLPRRHRENIVLNLIGQLLYYSTNGREVTRVQFEAGLQDWVQSYVNPSGYKLRNNTEFHRLYGFNAPPTKRIAIEKIYKRSGEIRQDFFKNCLNFLTIDESDKTKLKVVYPKVDMIFFYFGICVQLVDFMIFAFFVYIYVAVYAHWIFMLVSTIPCAIIIGMMPLVQPYFIARKIDREVQRLRIQ
ncbi:hypothetical protein [Scytonema millei]|uniref:Uncharacterized protein n=1 Tax=Scytonema millei VB511283 TaxID=1245923 RepID=A0A9X5EC56_9CYAN|nr:hypothetical protein [Scytonema millei]NHC37549.1 hypothetical protein [Scytonema millei VB511283]